MRSPSWVGLMFAAACAVAHGESERQTAGAGNRGPRDSDTDVFNVAVPAHPFDLILARPETKAVTLSVVAYENAECVVAFGPEAGTPFNVLPAHHLAPREPVALRLTELQPDTGYRYEFRYRTAGTQAFAVAAEGKFHTARLAGATFTFTLTADAHLDGHTSAEVYLRTLANIAADAPDFHLDLGNLFMTDKHRTRDEAAAQYLAQRYYLGRIGTPVLLALGTHDGESGKDETGADGLAAWARRMRTRYFPNPVSDDFYSGNSVAASEHTLLQNYYAWTWGDALFVVLDPFGNTTRARGGKDGWAWTLGRAQYQWLERTLRESGARYKFVFIHNLLSGDQAARGGIEVAGFNEWGGKNADGTDGFARHRPGWTEPVHALLVRNHVTAVFKAHDNFYARQELDGIPYIMVPQPSFAGTDRIRDLETYGYKTGKFLGNSGHLRVTVSPEQVAVEYVSSSSRSRILDHIAILPSDRR